MFKIKRFMTFFGAAMLLILTSCEFGSLEKREASGSVVVDLSSVKDRLTSSSRTAYKDLLSSDFDTFADLKLEGDFETSQTINLNETEIVQIDNIPVGSKITASIEIYINIDLQDEGRSFKETKWHGTSEVYEITDGPNVIIIPLTRGGNEEIIDEPEEEENKITIYVKYDETKPASFWNDTSNKSNENSENDGKSLNTAFNYIQSAVDWIAQNGDGNEDYEIMLTGYDDTHAFEQDVYYDENHSSTASLIFGEREADVDNLKNKAKSITLTSDDYTKTAMNVNHSMYNILIRTSVRLIFKNIKITTTSHSRILFTKKNSDCNVFLKTNTFFSDITDPEVMSWQGSSAIIVEGGSVTMQDNSKIENFYANDGGAAYIDYGHLIMEDNSRIENCKAETDGGAIYVNSDALHQYFQIKDNATIYKCSAGYDVGAISQTGGTVYIEGGSIIKCKAERYGGAFNVVSDNKTVDFYLRGGTIKDNEAANQGSALDIAKAVGSSRTPSFYLSDDACIDLSNDIYSSGVQLQLESRLTTSNEKAALVKFGNYTDGTKVLSGSEEDIHNSYSKFFVSTSDANNDYYLNSNGVLNKFSNFLESSDSVNIGDIVFADNKRVSADQFPNLSKRLRDSIAGVVFFVGGTDEDAPLKNQKLIAGTTIYKDYYEDNVSNSHIFDNTDIPSFPGYESNYNLESKIKIEDIQSADFSGVLTGNTGIDNVFDMELESIDDLINGACFPLYGAVICHGENFTDTSYKVNTDPQTENWYIPTIAEYYFFAKALEDETFKDIYLKLSNMDLERNYISETVVHNENIDPPVDPNRYNFIINFTSKEISCGSTSLSLQYTAIPVHIYEP